MNYKKNIASLFIISALVIVPAVAGASILGDVQNGFSRVFSQFNLLFSKNKQVNQLGAVSTLLTRDQVIAAAKNQALAKSYPDQPFSVVVSVNGATSPSSLSVASGNVVNIGMSVKRPGFGGSLPEDNIGCVKSLISSPNDASFSNWPSLKSRPEGLGMIISSNQWNSNGYYEGAEAVSFSIPGSYSFSLTCKNADQADNNKAGVTSVHTVTVTLDSTQLPIIDNTSAGVKIVEKNSQTEWTGSLWTKGDTRRLVWNPNYFIKQDGGAQSVDVYFCLDGATNLNSDSCLKMNPKRILGSDVNFLEIPFVWVPETFNATGGVDKNLFLAVVRAGETSVAKAVTTKRFLLRSVNLKIINPTTGAEWKGGVWNKNETKTVYWYPAGFVASNVDVYLCKKDIKPDALCQLLKTVSRDAGSTQINFAGVSADYLSDGPRLVVTNSGTDKYYGLSGAWQSSIPFNPTSAVVVAPSVVVPVTVTQGKDFMVNWSPISYWAGGSRVLFWLCPKNEMSLYPGDGTLKACKSFYFSSNTGSKTVPASVTQTLPLREENYLLITKDNTSVGAFSNKFAITDGVSSPTTPATVTVKGPVIRGDRFSVSWTKESFGSESGFVQIDICDMNTLSRCQIGRWSNIPNKGFYNDLSSLSLSAGQKYYLYIKKQGDLNNTGLGNNFSNGFDVIAPAQDLKLTITGGTRNVGSTGQGGVPAVFALDQMYGFKVEGAKSGEKCMVQVGGSADSYDQNTRTFSFVGDTVFEPSTIVGWEGMINGTPGFVCRTAGKDGVMTSNKSCGNTKLSSQLKDDTKAFLKCGNRPTISIPMHLRPEVTSFSVNTTWPTVLLKPVFTYRFTADSGVKKGDKNLDCVITEKVIYGEQDKAESAPATTSTSTYQYNVKASNGRFVSKPEICKASVGANGKVKQYCTIVMPSVVCTQKNTKEKSSPVSIPIDGAEGMSRTIAYGFNSAITRAWLDFINGAISALNTLSNSLPKELIISAVSSGNSNNCKPGYQTDQDQKDVRNPEMAIDVATSTFWSSCTKSPTNWFKVDLGSVKEVTKIEMLMEPGVSTTHYSVDVSADDVKYDSVLTNGSHANSGGKQQVDIPLSSAKGRYLRINFPGPEEDHIVIYNLKVIGK